MAKQIKNMDEILERLDQQDAALRVQRDQQQQVIWLLKGNRELEIEGVIPSLKTLKKDVHDLAVWKDSILNAKWKLDLKYVGKWLGGIAAVVGGIVGVFELLRMVL